MVDAPPSAIELTQRILGMEYMYVFLVCAKRAAVHLPWVRYGLCPVRIALVVRILLGGVWGAVGRGAHHNKAWCLGGRQPPVEDLGTGDPQDSRTGPIVGFHARCTYEVIGRL